VIPLRDINHAETRPIATWTLLAINLAVFAYQLSLDASGERAFVMEHGFIPLEFSVGKDLEAVIDAFTSMFMHGGFMHIISNMWFLHVFGDNVEDALGTPKFVLFYLGTGLAAVVAQYLAGPESALPMVGASGAIAGVLGGYLRLFPHARIVTLIPIFIVMIMREIPAFIFLFVWFGLQLFQGVGSLGVHTQSGGVAFFAHIGGFVAGVLLIMILGRRKGGGSGGKRNSGWGRSRDFRDRREARHWNA
jgi:membrane associated rhomboid family serine protease